MKHGVIQLCILAFLATPTLNAATTNGRNAERNGTADSAYSGALNALHADGWHDITGLQRQGDYVRATTQDFDGQQRSVLVDPRTGVVFPDMDATLVSGRAPMANTTTMRRP